MSIILGSLQLKSEIPRAALNALGVEQLNLLLRYTKVTKQMCRNDPVAWKFLKDTGYAEKYFDAKDYELIEEVLAEKANVKSVGIRSVQESVASLQGTFKWELEKITYQLPGKEIVVRKNTVIPVEHAPTRPGTACLRTFICQFYDIAENQLVMSQSKPMIEAAFGHPLCPINPSGIRSFMSILEKVLPKSISYKQATRHNGTVTGIAMYSLVGRFLEELEIGDYFSLHQAFITSAIRGWALVAAPVDKSDPAKKEKTAPKKKVVSPIRFTLKNCGAAAQSVLIMNRKIATEMKYEQLYDRYVKLAGCEPMVFVGGMTPTMNIPNTVPEDQFMTIVTQVGTFISIKRGLGPVAECMNYQPLQSPIGREASFLMFCYKLAKRLKKTKIDIVVSSVAVIKILKTQIAETEFKTKTVQFVNLGKQSKAMIGEKESGSLRPGSFVLAEKTMVIPPPSAKKNAMEYYDAMATEYAQLLPESGIFSATVFHKKLLKGRQLLAFKHSLNAVGIFCTDDVSSVLEKTDEVTVVPDWAWWIKANLIAPKRILLSAVCPDLFGSSMGNHVKYDSLVVTREAGTIDDYTFVNREEDWNDFLDEEDALFWNAKADENEPDEQSDEDDNDEDEAADDDADPDEDDEKEQSEAEDADEEEEQEEKHSGDDEAPPLTITPTVPVPKGRRKGEKAREVSDDEEEEEEVKLSKGNRNKKKKLTEDQKMLAAWTQF